MASKSFTLSFLGDVMLGRLIDQLCHTHVECQSEAKIVQRFLGAHPELRDYGPHTPWGNSISLLRSSALRLVNLETSVTTHPVPWPNKVFNYRMHPANMDILKVASIDYVSLANNHALDYSEPGLDETVNTVDNAGIRFAGVGHSIGPEDRATGPAHLKLQNHHVHVFAASDHPSDWKTVPRFNLIDYSPNTKSRLREQTQSSRPVSLKIFSIHWGPNYSWHPSARIRDMAHYLIDECGIDIIHGHSSHHIQGVEVYKGRPIIYGCGDFVDDYALTEEYRNDLSAVWQVVVAEVETEKLRPVRVEVHPSRIQHFQANLLDPADSDHAWVKEKLIDLSSELGTQPRTEPGSVGQLIIDVA